MEEVRGLLERGTLKLRLQEEWPDGAKALTGRFLWRLNRTQTRQLKTR